MSFRTALQKPWTGVRRAGEALGAPPRAGFDWIMLTATVLLVGTGIVMIYSASAVSLLGEGAAEAQLARQQAWMAVFGFAAIFVLAHLPYHILDYSFGRIRPLYLLLAAVFVLMVLVPAIGHKVNGARRWLNIGGVNVQPSEFVKPALVAYFAWNLSRKKDQAPSFWRGVVPPTFLAGVFIGLVILQKDLGTAIVYGGITAFMLLIAGARKRHMAVLAFGALAGVAGLILSEPYRMRRMMAFMDPSFDPQGVGYQVRQAKLAFGLGGLEGMGLGQGKSKFDYLPEAHTDYIFAEIGEELGFIGIVCIMLVFAVWAWRGLVIARRSVDLFGNYLALGLTFSILMPALWNMGVAMGSLPSKGLALPFISYGRSSLLVSLVSVGLLQNISMGGKAKSVRVQAIRGNRRRPVLSSLSVPGVRGQLLGPEGRVSAAGLSSPGIGPGGASP
jgi:cell division protein FtsW